MQVISHFLFECYKTDVACDVVSKSSYPTTVRRKHTGTGSEQAKCAQKWGSFKNMNYQDAEFVFCWSDTQTSRQYQVSLKIKATSPLFLVTLKSLSLGTIWWSWTSTSGIVLLLIRFRTAKLFQPVNIIQVLVRHHGVILT